SGLWALPRSWESPTPHCPLDGRNAAQSYPRSALDNAAPGNGFRCESGLAGVVLDDVEERCAVAFQLGVADTVDLAHRARAGRPMGGKLDQSTIREHDVGRHLLGLSELRSERLQRLEQDTVRFAHHHRRRGRALVTTRGGRGGLGEILAQLDRRLALEHAPTF